MTLFKWSRTAATNGTADSTCPFPEGMAPSALNDGTRGMMAAIAKYRDDTAGAIQAGGSANAYTVSSFEGFSSYGDLAGQVIAFSPLNTNGDTVTLSVDGLGARPLRPAPGVEFLAGTLIQGTPYAATYNASDGVFYLRGYFASPYNVPLLSGMDYWDTVAPNSAFIFPRGQALSRAVYARAFARWGVSFGPGDGATTFNAPNKSGRVSAMTEAAASLLTGTYFGGNSTVIGAVGGAESQTLTAAQIPAITSRNAAQPIAVTSSRYLVGTAAATVLQDFNPANASGFRTPNNTASILQEGSSGNNDINVTSNNTGGQAHPIVPPTICCNYVIRVL